MSIDRREFMRTVTLAAAAGAAGSVLAQEGDMTRSTARRPLFVSTWPFGKGANEVALKVVEEGGSVLDAVEQGIGVIEEDESNRSVGYGGLPNAEGVVQLDACIMWGPEHSAGSVAAIEGILHPISVARRVMEQTPHVLLVGDGARQFALQQGFPSTEMLSPGARKVWESWKAKQSKADNHDTIALIGLGPDGNLAGGCSTSGWGYKLPGRVGDSPIIGSGLYVDQEVGAAGATGLGEIIMRYCGSFLVVEHMRQGMSPVEACAAVVRRIARREPADRALSVNFVALDKEGRFGAAGTDKGFAYSVSFPGTSQVFKDAVLEDPRGLDKGHHF